MTKEASMYEPRVGDLVTHTCVERGAVRVVGVYSGGVEVRGGTLLSEAGLTPLRPDAPGQRVRADGWIGYQSGVTVEPSTSPGGRAGFVVRWDDPANFLYKTSPWSTTFLIRIADQAPAAVVPACPETPAEAGAAMYAALVAPGPAALDAAAAQWARMTWTPTAGPTCQHCGSGIVAGLLRDTCPRGCDLTLRAAEPEPTWVHQAWNFPGTPGFVAPSSPGPGYERVWCAQGGGVHRMHPTREGAIAAWREAVRR